MIRMQQRFDYVNEFDMGADVILDVSGMQCPLPLLKSRMKLAEMNAGQVLHVITTDDHAPIDFKAYCAECSDEFLRCHAVDNRL